MKQKLLVICGLNATGKSDLAVKIAKKFDGEIISADSRQVYKKMDIGTGKDVSGIFINKFSNTNFQIGYYEVKGIKIWLLDVVEPDYRFNVADYERCAKVAVEDIRKRGKLPIVCGGTGLYIKATVDGIETSEIKPDEKDMTKDLQLEKAMELF